MSDVSLPELHEFIVRSTASRAKDAAQVSALTVLDDLGLGSLDLVVVFSDVERHFEFTLPDGAVQFDELFTVQDIFDTCEHVLSARAVR